ncbi:MAG: peptidase domain-containing ABC transporter [Dinghuibacter sp.]|nr:peptidase domain-containing ABC transporter [Dinghuibacter sp.]
MPFAGKTQRSDMWSKRFPFYKQIDANDCGVACVRMVARYYGKELSYEFLRKYGMLTRQGISLNYLGSLAESAGFRSLSVNISYDKLRHQAPKPAIVLWRQTHYIVVYKVTATKVHVADPALGLIQYTTEDFMNGWGGDLKDGVPQGIALLVEPTPEFFDIDTNIGQNRGSLKFILKYLKLFKPQIALLLGGLFIGTLLQLLLPFLTQFVVDYGIGNRDVQFIYLVLAAQLFLFIGTTAVEFTRSWILTHVSSRVNVYIISDFLQKLMRLPINYFDSKVIGDLTQRIRDHKRIEEFITNTLIQSVFSIISILVLGSVLFFFNKMVFLVFLVVTIIDVIWIMTFLKKLRVIDNAGFQYQAEDQNKVYEIITGMQEIKLNNIENKKKWEWEKIQASIFKVNLRRLRINQLEQGGSRFLGYFESVLTVFICAMAVVNNEMTLGTMMAIIFITGQLNGPIGQILNFVMSAQMAKISLERLGEIHAREDEEPVGSAHNKMRVLPASQTLDLQNVMFEYVPKVPVLKDISFTIPEGKVTAIVGSSGSGKTTLVKLLLKFYEPVEGEIYVGDTPLQQMHSTYWRNHCGVVLQDSFIFSDTIAANIIGGCPFDEKRLQNAIKTANIGSFLDTLPMGLNTRIGASGTGISQGQKQRILIARAVYKNPQYIFFDEATNALDANNEKIIMENLEQFFHNRTVVVVAHRLSTVKNADQIIVLENGVIVEAGTHTELVEQNGYYFRLIKNQLELTT